MKLKLKEKNESRNFLKKTQTKRLYNKKVVEKLHCNMTSGHKSNKIFVINDWS